MARFFCYPAVKMAVLCTCCCVKPFLTDLSFFFFSFAGFETGLVTGSEHFWVTRALYGARS